MVKELSVINVRTNGAVLSEDPQVYMDLFTLPREIVNFTRT